MAALITRREETRALRLAAAQPESAGELTGLLADFASRVAAFASKAPRVRRRLAGSRARVVTVDYREDKPKGAGRARRLAEVGFYDYDNDVLVVAVVDPFGAAVVELVEREGVAPPISPEELGEARELLAAIPELRKALARRRAQVVAFPTPSYAFLPESDRIGHRGAAVHVAATGGAELHAVVDLSARDVVPDEHLDPVFRRRVDGR